MATNNEQFNYKKYIKVEYRLKYVSKEGKKEFEKIAVAGTPIALLPLTVKNINAAAKLQADEIRQSVYMFDEVKKAKTKAKEVKEDKKEEKENK